MNIKRLIATILLLCGTGIVLSAIIIKDKNLSEVDIVAINDVVKTVEKNWGRVSEETFDNHNIKYLFTIVDNSGNIIYQTPGNCARNET